MKTKQKFGFFVCVHESPRPLRTAVSPADSTTVTSTNNLKHLNAYLHTLFWLTSFFWKLAPFHFEKIIVSLNGVIYIKVLL
jgi:hypothetical protein